MTRANQQNSSKHRTRANSGVLNQTQNMAHSQQSTNTTQLFYVKN